MAALNNPHQAQDTGSLIINAGGNLVCNLENANWNSAATKVDVRGLCRAGYRGQPTGQQATLSVKAFGDSSVGFVSTDFELTTLTFGGVTVLPQAYSFTMNGDFDKAPLPSLGLFGMAEGVVGQNYTGSFDLQIDDTDIVQALIIASESSTLANRRGIVDFVLGGKEVKFDAQLDGNTHSFQQGAYQRITLPYSSDAPARGTAFPTLPTTLPGSPGLADYALLTPRQNLPFTFISKATHGIVRTGFLTWDGFVITITDGAITDFSYTWKTFADWTTTNNGA